MDKRTLFIGFTLFAMFFGAGNLIFPPKVGAYAGENFELAILGFIITGVGLPLIGIIAGSFAKEGFRTESKRIHPVFSVIFLIAIYLIIGPLFAIPRTATVSYEMVVMPFFSENINSEILGLSFSKVMLFISSGIYFTIALYLSLNPSKIVDRVGEMLTPILLLTISALIIYAFFTLGEPIRAIHPSFEQKPFFIGFSEGYQTMDALAAVAFSIIVINAIRAYGITDPKEILIKSFYAGIIAATALTLIYLSLGWIGNHYPLSEAEYALINTNNNNIGITILTGVARLTYGEFGRILLSTIIALACLTTAIGLIVAISTYFHELYSKLSYKTYAIIFTIISFILANQGLTQVIEGATPVLLVIYPITIVLIMLIIVDRVIFSLPNICLQIPIYVTTFVSILSVIFIQLNKIAEPSGFILSFKSALQKILENLPFYESSMEWMLPALIAFIFSLLISSRLLFKKQPHNTH